MVSKKINLIYFCNNLRLLDNPSLYEACKGCVSVIPIYIMPEKKLSLLQKNYLHCVLNKLNFSLDKKLLIFKGKAENILPYLCEKYSIQKVFWEKKYCEEDIQENVKIKKILQGKNIHVQEDECNLLWKSDLKNKNTSLPYRVFTRFYRDGCLSSECRKVLPEIDKNKLLKIENEEKASYEVFKSECKEKTYSESKLNNFIKEKIAFYQENRDVPCLNATSNLSKNLSHGEISPSQIWEKVKDISGSGADCFRSELGWREFSYNLLHHNPRLHKDNLNGKFNFFPWRSNDKYLQAWKNGETGIPLVDAGMKQLLSEGNMHNRLRMITASFLVKNLLIHWKYGAQWFMDNLLDADIANNYAGWQWVSGSGADSVPYFRIFNPVLQGEKYDADGEYVKKYIPILKKVPSRYIHNLWEAPQEILQSAGVKLGENYPFPIVNLRDSVHNVKKEHEKYKLYIKKNYDK